MLPLLQFCSVLVILCIGITGQNADNYRLQLVQMIWRHGDRAPIALYPNDPNPEASFPEGLGKLSAKGKNQHYSLGKLLRFAYNDYITTSPSEINVFSAYDDRCLDSATSNLASFYSPKQGAQFHPEVYWQPITVHYMANTDEDKYLNQFSDCPRAEMEMKKSFDSPESRAFDEQHKEMFDYLTEHSGFPITDWFTAAALHDTLKVEKSHNMTIPEWVDPYWDELNEVANMIFYWLYKDPKIQRLRGGPLLGLMIDKMKKKISGDDTKLKVQVYSAHDSTVAVVLSALHLLPIRLVPYCATLIFELWTGPDEGHFVRTIYLNSTEPENVVQEPNVLKIEGCDELCPLEYFENYVKDVIPEDWEEECKVPEE